MNTCDNCGSELLAKPTKGGRLCQTCQRWIDRAMDIQSMADINNRLIFKCRDKRLTMLSPGAGMARNFTMDNQ